MKDDISGQLDQLDQAFEATGAVAATFQSELQSMRAALRDAGRDVQSMSATLNRGFRGAIDGMVFDGDRLSDALKTIGKSMLDAAYSAAVRPVTTGLSGLVAKGMEQVISGSLTAGSGGGFADARVRPFARGGVIGGPTYFPMQGATGLMGEAGPEAIMPLGRGPDGRLGVRAQGGGRPVQVTMNITTPNAETFARSRTQIAAGLSRAIERGQRSR